MAEIVGGLYHGLKPGIGWRRKGRFTVIANGGATVEEYERRGGDIYFVALVRDDTGTVTYTEHEGVMRYAPDVRQAK